MDQTDAAALRVAYQRDTAVLLRQQLLVFGGIFVVFMGLGTLVEVFGYPARNPWSWIAYLSECAVIGAGIALAYRPGQRASPGWIGAAASVSAMTIIAAYHGFVMAPALRVVMTLSTVLGAVSVILPWGPWPQSAAGAAAVLLVSVGVACDRLPLNGETILMPTTAIFATASITAVGAWLLDRYRFEAFRRTTMQAEEAEVAAGLLTITQMLNLHLHDPDMFERVAGQTVATVGADFSSVYLLDPDRRRYVLAAVATTARPATPDVSQVEFAHDALPLFEHFRPGAVVVIADAEAQSLVPIEVMRRFHMTSGLWAPIGRGTTLTGVLVAGHNSRTGLFSDKQQRLMVGIAHAIAMALDNRRLVTELGAANQLKSEFVATMSHELRTPLNVIAGYAEMIDDRVFEPGTTDWADAIGRIRRSTEELNELVGATLDLNRLESGREPVDRQPVDLGPMLARIENQVEPLAQAGVALRWHLTLLDPHVVTDATKLKTIIKNLVTNALKFTSRGSVEVTIGADGDALMVSVRDTGIGIAPEHLQTIFEMFRQIDGSSTRRFGGVGLGLHIVKRLVGTLGGSVQVESALGTGSTFHVRIPKAVGVPGTAARAIG
jgi:signal transduction histidine kinase